MTQKHTPQRIITSLFGVDGTRKYLTTPEIRRFLFHAEKCPEEQKLLCQVLAYTGCRLTEALRITGASIDEEAQALTLQTLKQRRQNVYRQVPVPQFLIFALQRHLADSARERIWLVHRQTARRWIAGVMDEAELTGSRANSRGLRHGFAVGCVEEDVPITVLKKWLGHARLETTAIYTNVVGAEEIALAERRWVSMEC